MSKIIKKAISIILWVFTGFAVFFLVVYLLLNLSVVQTWLVQRFSNHFAEVLNTRVEIKRVNISFPNSLVLEGFQVDDRHGNLLLNVPYLDVAAGKLFFNENNIMLKHVTLNDATFNLREYKGEKENNLAFILRQFTSVDSSS